MQETARLAKSFADLYHGDPWIDVTIMDTLAPITAAQAAQKVIPNWNSIWQIVNHLISWRLNVLRRLQGETMVSPADNYFEPVQDTSDAAWQSTLRNLAESQQKWLDLLENFSENNFDTIYTANPLTYYEHIQGILQHDAYHLGQIVLLAKLT